MPLRVPSPVSWGENPSVEGAPSHPQQNSAPLSFSLEELYPHRLPIFTASQPRVPTAKPSHPKPCLNQAPAAPQRVLKVNPSSFGVRMHLASGPAASPPAWHGQSRCRLRLSLCPWEQLVQAWKSLFAPGGARGRLGLELQAGWRGWGCPACTELRRQLANGWRRNRLAIN